MRAFAYPLMEEACFVKGKFNRSNAIKEVKEKQGKSFRSISQMKLTNFFGTL